MVAHGETEGIVLARRGTVRYRVQCGDKTIAQGTMRVLRDAGVARLPAKPAYNVLDANGMEYRVVYSNLLPTIAFRWRNAKGDAVLHVTSEASEAQTIAAPGGSATLASGRLVEGRYDWWFQAADGSAHKSPTSYLRIVYQNAAPKASIRKPPVDAPVDGIVEVAGVALNGWVTSVGETPLAVDQEQRFFGRVTRSDDEDAIAIRLTHVDHGVHYYLRRGQAR
jgi:hypothetical protein